MPKVPEIKPRARFRIWSLPSLWWPCSHRRLGARERCASFSQTIHVLCFGSRSLD